MRAISYHSLERTVGSVTAIGINSETEQFALGDPARALTIDSGPFTRFPALQ